MFPPAQPEPGRPGHADTPRGDPLSVAVSPRTSLRIGIVAENYFPTLGGIQEHVLHLRRYLAGAGAKVSIITGRVPPVTGPTGPADAEESVMRAGPAFRYGINGTYTYATI